MEKIEFELESVCPLKMDRWQDGLQPKSPEEYKKQAEHKIYVDEKGYISIPSTALKSCLKWASSEIADNQKKYSGKKMRQSISAQVFFQPNYLRILPETKKHDGIVEDVVTRGVSDKVTRVTTYRPIINKWKLKGQIAYIGLSPDFLKQALELAGFKYGLLSHRPEFGRFIITKFKEAK